MWDQSGKNIPRYDPAIGGFIVIVSIEDVAVRMFTRGSKIQKELIDL